MILGTYWYFEFPTNLYRFEYFEFNKGYGGHADNPAELVATFVTEHPEKILEELKTLINKYSEGFLFVYQENNKLKIGTGGHQLFDYDFLLITEVEKLLKDHSVILTKDKAFDKPIITRISNDKNKTIYPKKGFLQIVGSDLKKHNAENSKLRMDCHVNVTVKAEFISELRKISDEENIDIFFYYDKDLNEKSNLMLFFTNGRQGLHLTEKKHINTISFENKIEQVILKYNVNLGHIDGFENYPQNGPHIEMMIEKEFII